MVSANGFYDTLSTNVGYFSAWFDDIGLASWICGAHAQFMEALQQVFAASITAPASTLRIRLWFLLTNEPGRAEKMIVSA